MKENKMGNGPPPHGFIFLGNILAPPLPCYINLHMCSKAHSFAKPVIHHTR